MNNEDIMADVLKLLKSKDFQTEEEMLEFIDNITVDQFDLKSAISELESNDEELALDLVNEAFDSEFEDEGYLLVQQALDYDKNCIYAFEYLAQNASSPVLANVYINEALRIGELKFNKDVYDGPFWYDLQTRTYIRCLKLKSDIAILTDTLSSVETLEKIINLNPDDNLGVRNRLSIYYLAMHKHEKFLELEQKFDDEDFCYKLFNKALYFFITEGDTENAKNQLKIAKKANKHVVPLITTKDLKVNFGYDAFQLGDKSEARNYYLDSIGVWQAVDGAIDWLKKSLSADKMKIVKKK